jgi:DNA polymerase-3 subunit epsilon
MKAFFYDLETTGPDANKDKIVQIAIVVICLKTWKVEYQKKSLINPEIPILEEAKEVHGISDEDVKDAPKFCELSKEIAVQLAKVEYLGGYNNFQFDDLILEREFNECGFTSLDLSELKMMDMFKLFNQVYPRTLSSVYNLLTGKELEDAHDALADVTATIEILKVMNRRVDVRKHLSEIESSVVDRAGIFKKGEILGGKVYITIGKHKGEKLEDLARSGRPYLEWMCSDKANFAKDTKKIASMR